MSSSSPLHQWIALVPETVHVLRQARRAATAPVPLLIEGEPGTGKSLLIELLHLSSPFRFEPCLEVDCAAWSPEQVREQLFGANSYAESSGARGFPGRLLQAGQGTVVLDNIAALSLDLQEQLLNAVQPARSRHRRPAVRARVVGLSTVPLEQAVARRDFSLGLWERLSTYRLMIPPLRQRQPEIVPLARHLLDRLARLERRPVPRLAPETEQLLADYPYPGNVRELQVILQQALAHSGVRTLELLAGDLPAELRPAQAAAAGQFSLQALEKAHIAAALRQVGWNYSEAARRLGISRKTLLAKRKRYQID